MLTLIFLSTFTYFGIRNTKVRFALIKVVSLSLSHAELYLAYSGWLRVKIPVRDLYIVHFFLLIFFSSGSSGEANSRNPQSRCIQVAWTCTLASPSSLSL